ncbi:MAG: HAMP domain-containing sensor histidine kinase, partial [Chloroflexota bacterium]
TEGKMKLSIANIDPVVLLSSAVNASKGLSESKQVSLKLDISIALPTICGDEKLLARVLDNLLSNALKYTPPHGNVVVSARPKSGTVEFIVRDSGIGISNDDQAHIFAPFTQTDGPNQKPGSGLGLAFCHKVVTAHNGNIGVASQLGQGSTFYFTIPTAV